MSKNEIIKGYGKAYACFHFGIIDISKVSSCGCLYIHHWSQDFPKGHRHRRNQLNLINSYFYNF